MRGFVTATALLLAGSTMAVAHIPASCSPFLIVHQQRSEDTNQIIRAVIAATNDVTDAIAQGQDGLELERVLRELEVRERTARARQGEALLAMLECIIG